jgi:esterase/lipase
MWDIRRILHWIRAQGAPSVGVHGVSLGGYQTALLAALERTSPARSRASP